jgi:hypothetical protein
MGILDFIDPFYFFIAFFVGMFFVYVLAPTPEVILRYPTPTNAGKMVYQDHADTCYVYDAKKVSCPATGAIQTPIQHADVKEANNKSLWTKAKQKIGAQ